MPTKYGNIKRLPFPNETFNVVYTVEGVPASTRISGLSWIRHIRSSKLISTGIADVGCDDEENHKPLMEELNACDVDNPRQA